jgi:DNA-cytosine methyltransferase
MNAKVDNYYASEIDKYAITVTQANYPDTVQLGDITKWNEWDVNFESIDLIVAGSPCQGFSFAGRQLNFDDPRSKLFFTFVDILNHIRSKNPDLTFILENVKMRKDHEQVITDTLGVEPIRINSALVSAQNRQRLYWTNIKDIAQPADKGIVLSDIIETGVVDRNKSHCVDANYFKGGNLKSYFLKHRRQLVFSKDGLCHSAEADINGHESIKRVYHPAGKSPTVNAMTGGNREPKILDLTHDVPVSFTERRTAEAKAIRRAYMKQHGKDWSPRRAKEMTIREDGRANTLTTSLTKEHLILDETWTFRKLTPLECERLQTVPDNYTNHVSNTQRYRMLGNGFTVDVICHLLKNI